MPPQQPYEPQYQMPPTGVGMSASQQAKSSHSTLVMVLLITFIILFLGATGFSIWALGQIGDYKSNLDKKVAQETAKASQRISAEKDAQLAQKEKEPYRRYVGPKTFGSLDISYPKTWSVYVAQDDKNTYPIDGYFHPDVVPGFQSGTAYALRVRVSSQDYAQELKQFDGKAKSGKVKITAYAPVNVPGVTGSRIEGEINNGQKDYMIMVPLRDKTLKIWSESPSFLNDFNDIILKNLKFVP